VTDIMNENHIKPLDVIALEIVLGGDHGKGAFRLAFRAIVTVTSGTMYHCDYGGVAYVTGKDTPDVLEAAIMDWLTTDLEAINSKKVVLDVLQDGNTACAFVNTDEEVSGSRHCHSIQHVTIYNTGDLKWMAMLLGMVDMSSEWCIFCMLHKKQWLENNHRKGNERTIQKIQELAAEKNHEQQV